MAFATIKTLGTMLRGRKSGGDHQQSLDDFYGPQADNYDSFRERLLHGRNELIQSLAIQPGERVIELGGGTGRNLEFFADRVTDCEHIDLVDLCEPLLEIAKQRIHTKGWGDVVQTHLADACKWKPSELADVVYCSYSPSMIPDWQGALQNACAWLKPGGRLGIVDFYVSPSHSWFTRTFWPRWFRHDGVHLRPEYLTVLNELIDVTQLNKERGKVPYLMGMSVPYMRCIGTARPPVQSDT